MKTKEEIRDWILENCMDDGNMIDLSGLDFGDKSLRLSEIKAGSILNVYQEAEHSIDNEGQKSHKIYNDKQEARNIYNFGQKSNHDINNSNQQATSIANNDQEANKIYT